MWLLSYPLHSPLQVYSVVHADVLGFPLGICASLAPTVGEEFELPRIYQIADLQSKGYLLAYARAEVLSNCGSPKPGIPSSIQCSCPVCSCLYVYRPLATRVDSQNGITLLYCFIQIKGSYAWRYNPAFALALPRARREGLMA